MGNEYRIKVMFINISKIHKIVLIIPLLFPVVVPHLNANPGDAHYGMNEYKMYGLSKYQFEEMSYLVDKNIKSFVNTTAGKEYWAYKAIDEKLIEIKDEVACKYAESIKNLKIILSVISKGNYEETKKFLDAQYAGIENFFVTPLTEENKEKLLGLLNGALVSETINLMVNNLNFFENYYLSIDLDNQAGFHEVYSCAFKNVYNRLVEMRNNNDVIASIVNFICQKNQIGRVGSSTNAENYGFLENILYHDWNCYLTQFGIISQTYFRYSVLRCKRVLSDEQYELSENGSELLTSHKLYGKTNAENDDSRTDVYNVLKQIEAIPQFKKDLDKAKTKCNEILGCAGDTFININKYNSVYIRYVSNWCQLQNLIRKGVLADNIYDRMLSEISHYLTVFSNVYDPKVLHFCIKGESRMLCNLMENINLYAKHLDARDIDDSWFNRYFENIKRVGENYFYSSFEPDLCLLQKHALILTAIPPESADAVVNKFFQSIAPSLNDLTEQYLDLYFYKTLLLTLVDFKTYEQNIDYWDLPDYIVTAMEDKSDGEKFSIVCEIIAQLKKINKNNEKISTLKKAIESVIDDESGKNEE